MTDTEPLTEDERKELEALRAEKDKPQAEVKVDETPLPDSHWLNLADGSTVTSKGVMSHVNGIPVLHATEIPAALLPGGDPNAEPAHRF